METSINIKHTRVGFFLSKLKEPLIIYNISTVTDTGWYPELVFLLVVFSNSTDLAVVIPNSTVKHKLFAEQPRENQTRYSLSLAFQRKCII